MHSTHCCSTLWLWWEVLLQELCVHHVSTAGPHKLDQPEASGRSSQHWFSELFTWEHKCAQTQASQMRPPGMFSTLSPPLPVVHHSSYTPQEKFTSQKILFLHKHFQHLKQNWTKKGKKNGPSEIGKKWPQAGPQLKHSTCLCHPRSLHPKETALVSDCLTRLRGNGRSRRLWSGESQTTLLNKQATVISCKDNLFPICTFSNVSTTFSGLS